jgi:nicotinamidase-related amidase
VTGKAAGAGAPRDAAVLLIDLQNETLHPNGQLAGDFPEAAASTLAAIERLLDWGRAQGLPVIWARLAFRPGHFDAAWNSMSRERSTFVEGEWGSEILDRLDVRVGDILITKRRPSAFFGTDLDLVLRGLGVHTLYVGGVSTHWAVESTVRDAHSWDYRVSVVRQCVDSPMREYHEPSLRVMGSVFADVVDLDELTGPG